jgi:fido (protein-threonine AMPylation protein)
MNRRRTRKDFWNDDETTLDDIERGEQNRYRVLEELIEHALSIDPALDAARVAKWHKECFSGLSYVSAADECLLGAFRGSDPPRLRDMVVGVGGVRGSPPRDVQRQLDKFFSELQKRVGALARRIDIDRDKSPMQLREIAQIAGWAHGEWVCIHPFANGSGRTARLIANWVLVRFRLLPVVGIRPRPQHRSYAQAAAASMRGDHSEITQFILHLLEDVEP